MKRIKTNFLIRVIKVKKNSDGGATVQVEYDKKKVNSIVRKHYGQKKCSKQMVKNFILEAIKDAIK